MNLERTAAWMALLDAGVSAAVLHRLVEAFGGPAEILGASDQAWAAKAQVRPETAVRIRDAAADRLRRHKQLDVFQNLGMAILERGDAAYPVRLLELSSPPPALFALGTLEADDQFAISLVGPRAATPYGIEVARRLATEFAPIMTVVSGCALGIDSSAHEAALKAGGRTIGVMACGLDQDYPQGNGPLRARIVQSGALLSTYPPLTKAATHHFPERNELIAALSVGVIVVEASDRSGALVTAHAALELGREVYAVPGDITRSNSAGSNALIQQGAALVTRAADVLADLEPRLSGELAAIHRRRAEQVAPKPEEALPQTRGLLPAQEMLLAAIRHTNRQYDELLAEFVPQQLGLGEFAGALLQLELRGLVKQLPGKVFMPGRG